MQGQQQQQQQHGPRAAGAAGAAAAGVPRSREEQLEAKVEQYLRRDHYDIGRHLREIREEQEKTGCTETYTVEHLRRLLRFEYRRPFEATSKVHCSRIHPRGCTDCMSCHFCRQKTVDVKTHCGCEGRNGQPGGPRRGVWCGSCLMARMGENINEVLTRHDWRCPCCRGICNCSSQNCLRAHNGLLVTDQLVHEATSLGYKSVAHYLILTHLDATGAVAPMPAINPLQQHRQQRNLAAAAVAAAAAAAPGEVPGDARSAALLQARGRQAAEAACHAMLAACNEEFLAPARAVAAALAGRGIGLRLLDWDVVAEDDDQPATPGGSSSRLEALAAPLRAVQQRRQQQAAAAGMWSPTPQHLSSSSSIGGDGAAAGAGTPGAGSALAGLLQRGRGILSLDGDDEGEGDGDDGGAAEEPPQPRVVSPTATLQGQAAAAAGGGGGGAGLTSPAAARGTSFHAGTPAGGGGFGSGWQQPSPQGMAGSASQHRADLPPRPPPLFRPPLPPQQQQQQQRQAARQQPAGTPAQQAGPPPPAAGQVASEQQQRRLQHFVALDAGCGPGDFPGADAPGYTNNNTSPAAGWHQAPAAAAAAAAAGGGGGGGLLPGHNTLGRARHGLSRQGRMTSWLEAPAAGAAAKQSRRGAAAAAAAGEAGGMPRAAGSPASHQAAADGRSHARHTLPDIAAISAAAIAAAATAATQLPADSTSAGEPAAGAGCSMADAGDGDQGDGVAAHMPASKRQRTADWPAQGSEPPPPQQQQQQQQPEPVQPSGGAAGSTVPLHRCCCPLEVQLLALQAASDMLDAAVAGEAGAAGLGGRRASSRPPCSAAGVARHVGVLCGRVLDEAFTSSPLWDEGDLVVNTFGGATSQHSHATLRAAAKLLVLLGRLLPPDMDGSGAQGGGCALDVVRRLAGLDPLLDFAASDPPARCIVIDHCMQLLDAFNQRTHPDDIWAAVEQAAAAAGASAGAVAAAAMSALQRAADAVAAMSQLFERLLEWMGLLTSELHCLARWLHSPKDLLGPIHVGPFSRPSARVSAATSFINPPQAPRHQQQQEQQQQQQERELRQIHLKALAGLDGSTLALCCHHLASAAQLLPRSVAAQLLSGPQLGALLDLGLLLPTEVRRAALTAISALLTQAAPDLQDSECWLQDPATVLQLFQQHQPQQLTPAQQLDLLHGLLYCVPLDLPDRCAQLQQLEAAVRSTVLPPLEQLVAGAFRPRQRWLAARTGQQQTGQQQTRQRWTGQQHTCQQHTGQQWTGQQHTGQQWTGQQHTGQQWTGQQHTGQPWTGHQQTGQQWTGQQHTGQQWTGQQHMGQQWTGQQHTGQLWTGHQQTGQQQTGQQHTGQQQTGQQHTGRQWTGQQQSWFAAAAAGRIGPASTAAAGAGGLSDREQGRRDKHCVELGTSTVELLALVYGLQLQARAVSWQQMEQQLVAPAPSLDVLLQAYRHPGQRRMVLLLAAQMVLLVPSLVAKPSQGQLQGADASGCTIPVMWLLRLWLRALLDTPSRGNRLCVGVLTHVLSHNSATADLFGGPLELAEVEMAASQQRLGRAAAVMLQEVCGRGADACGPHWLLGLLRGLDQMLRSREKELSPHSEWQRRLAWQRSCFRALLVLAELVADQLGSRSPPGRVNATAELQQQLQQLLGVAAGWLSSGVLAVCGRTAAACSSGPAGVLLPASSNESEDPSAAQQAIKGSALANLATFLRLLISLAGRGARLDGVNTANWPAAGGGTLQHAWTAAAAAAHGQQQQHASAWQWQQQLQQAAGPLSGLSLACLTELVMVLVSAPRAARQLPPQQQELLDYVARQVVAAALPPPAGNQQHAAAAAAAAGGAQLYQLYRSPGLLHMLLGTHLRLVLEAAAGRGLPQTQRRGVNGLHLVRALLDQPELRQPPAQQLLLPCLARPLVQLLLARPGSSCPVAQLLVQGLLQKLLSGPGGAQLLPEPDAAGAAAAAAAGPLSSSSNGPLRRMAPLTRQQLQQLVRLLVQTSLQGCLTAVAALLPPKVVDRSVDTTRQWSQAVQPPLPVLLPALQGPDGDAAVAAVVSQLYQLLGLAAEASPDLQTWAADLAKSVVVGSIAGAGAGAGAGGGCDAATLPTHSLAYCSQLAQSAGGRALVEPAMHCLRLLMQAAERLLQPPLLQPLSAAYQQLLQQLPVVDAQPTIGLQQLSLVDALPRGQQLPHAISSQACSVAAAGKRAAEAPAANSAEQQQQVDKRQRVAAGATHAFSQGEAAASCAVIALTQQQQQAGQQSRPPVQQQDQVASTQQLQRAPRAAAAAAAGGLTAAAAAAAADGDEVTSRSSGLEAGRAAGSAQQPASNTQPRRQSSQQAPAEVQELVQVSGKMVADPLLTSQGCVITLAPPSGGQLLLCFKPATVDRVQQLLDAQKLRLGCWLSATRLVAKNVHGQNAYKATKHTQLQVTAAAPAAAAANVSSREHEAGSSRQCAAHVQQPQQRPPLVPIHQQQQPSCSRQTQGDSQATIKYITQPPG